MIRILANDGINPDGKKMMEDAGMEVITDKVEQVDLIDELNHFDGILVRSATQIRKDLIDGCPKLKLIGRGGVGMDNIDVTYAREKGIKVVNTPAASSESVAELALAHLMTCVRFLADANRKMPAEGHSNFSALKKQFSKGKEVRGKTIGIIGFGRIGQSFARLCLGLGMKVIAYDPFVEEAVLSLPIVGLNHHPELTVKTIPFDDVLVQSDFISLHVPAGKHPIIDKTSLSKMKDGVILINASRGGVVDETALIEALDVGKVSFAGMDVFINEPKPRAEILQHSKVSLTPHIGASTEEAQQRVWTEMAQQVIDFFK